MDYTQEFREIIINVSRLLGREVDMNKVEIIDRGMPHKPHSLKPGTMGVYAFNYKGRFLKIGKAGPNSNNRFLYQHYKPGAAMSTLAGSILPDPEMEGLGITESNIGEWIKSNCRRIDILLNVDLGIFTLELVEAALHYKYEPKYEGFASQR
jgi:hypothetical protein